MLTMNYLYGGKCADWGLCGLADGLLHMQRSIRGTRLVLICWSKGFSKVKKTGGSVEA
jgi:hypothetical protein